MLLFAFSPFRLFPTSFFARPHQHFARFVDRQLFGLNQFDLQVLDIPVIQVKLPLQCPVGDPPLALEPRDRVPHHFRKLHTLAALRSPAVLAILYPRHRKSQRSCL